LHLPFPYPGIFFQNLEEKKRATTHKRLSFNVLQTGIPFVISQVYLDNENSRTKDIYLSKQLDGHQ